MVVKTGVERRIFDEVQAIHKMKWLYAEEQDAADNVESLSQSMILYPSEDYLSGDHLVFDYDENVSF